MNILSTNQIRQYCINAGFSQNILNAALSIAYCESSFDADAIGDNGNSIGLFQIHVPSHPEFNPTLLFDPQYNCNAAYQIYTQAGYNFTDWTCARILNLENPLQIKPLYLGIALAFVIGIGLYYK